MRALHIQNLHICIAAYLLCRILPRTGKFPAHCRPRVHRPAPYRLSGWKGSQLFPIIPNANSPPLALNNDFTRFSVSRGELNLEKYFSDSVHGTRDLRPNTNTQGLISNTQCPSGPHQTTKQELTPGPNYAKLALT
jgi:hypothetical protein